MQNPDRLHASPSEPKPVAYRDPRPSRTARLVLDLVNSFLFMSARSRVQEVDLPEADLARLRSHLKPGSATFLAVNHPEFLADLSLDKWLAEKASPLVAFYVNHEVLHVHPALRWCGLGNNAIANVPGGGGADYAVRWALQGHGVLIHPEGTSRWHGDQIGPLLPGVAHLAIDTHRRAQHQANGGPPVPVRILPVVWKYRFLDDATPDLHRELAHIERRFDIPSGRGLRLEQRWARLLQELIPRRAQAHGLAMEPSYNGCTFDAAAELTRTIEDGLAERHGAVQGSFAQRQHVWRRLVRESANGDAERARRERERVDEWGMWNALDPALYGTERISQERIAESLLRLRLGLLRGRWTDTVFNALPRPVASRVAHIRVGEPLDMAEALASVDPDASGRRRREHLLADLRARMQARLDQLNAEIAPAVGPFSRPNPLKTR